MSPTTSANTNTTGPKLANMYPRSGAFASATVPKILVLVKYPLPVNKTSHALLTSVIFKTYRIAKKIIAPVASVPRTRSHGLSLNPVVMYIMTIVKNRM